MPKHRLLEPSASQRRTTIWGTRHATTFITTALENGAQIEDVQKVAVHRGPGATKPFDRHLLPIALHGRIASGKSR
jgi:hypothetical protein